MTRFASATRDELWLNGRLAERRLSHGEAHETPHGFVATDTRDEALVHACDEELTRLQAYVVADARVRLVAEATLEGVTGTITVTKHGRSIVTSPEHLEDDLALLDGFSPADFSRDPGGLKPAAPLVWRNGTAAVLLHEAIGHAREHHHEELSWPSWLEIDIPLKPRRASFRDVPLLRMTHVLARQHDAPFELPGRRIEILLVDGGTYEPLTQLVTIRIAAANFINGDEVEPLAPFVWNASRRTIAASLTGAEGEPIRYPGVICSREGQELVVGTYAPVMVTR